MNNESDADYLRGVVRECFSDHHLHTNRLLQIANTIANAQNDALSYQLQRDQCKRDIEVMQQLLLDLILLSNDLFKIDNPSIQLARLAGRARQLTGQQLPTTD